MIDKPLNCPFCGSEGKAVTDSSGHWHWVICSSDPKDAMLIGCDDTAAKAIARWNTRAVDPRVAQAQAECDRLRGELVSEHAALLLANAGQDQLEKERDKARAMVAFATEELVHIANADYRGNRSGESDRADKALARLREMRGKKGQP